MPAGAWRSKMAVGSAMLRKTWPPRISSFHLPLKLSFLHDQRRKTTSSSEARWAGIGKSLEVCNTYKVSVPGLWLLTSYSTLKLSKHQKQVIPLPCLWAHRDQKMTQIIAMLLQSCSPNSVLLLCPRRPTSQERREEVYMCFWLSSLKKQYMSRIRIKSSGLLLLASHYIPILQNTKTVYGMLYVRDWLRGDWKEVDAFVMFWKGSTALPWVYPARTSKATRKTAEQWAMRLSGRPLGLQRLYFRRNMLSSLDSEDAK